MYSEGKVVCIGEYDIVFPFKAVNLEVEAVSSGQEALEAVRKFKDAGYALILVQEDFLEAIQSVLDETIESPLPAIISIPGSESTRGQALLRLREVIKKAVGMDIFAEK